MAERTVDEEIRLIPYYRNDAVSLPWYQDPDVCRQVDNRDTPYDAELLHSMYDYLSAHGDCYYIEYNGVPVCRGRFPAGQRRNSHCGLQGISEQAHRTSLRHGYAEAYKGEGDGESDGKYLFL